MTNRELFENARRLVCEGGAAVEVSDYEDRAGYILANLISLCIPLDNLYCRTQEEGGQSAATVRAKVSLDESFPLSDIFVPAATQYLASLLVVDESEELSDRFFAGYADAISKIRTQLPAKCEPIINRYPGLI